MYLANRVPKRSSTLPSEVNMAAYNDPSGNNVQEQLTDNENENMDPVDCFRQERHGNENEVAVNASAAGDLSVQAMKLLTQNNNVLTQNTNVLNRSRVSPTDNMARTNMHPTNFGNKRNGKRQRPYGSPDIVDNGPRKRMRYNEPSALFGALAKIQTSLRANTQRRGWLDRCEYINKRMQECFNALDTTELKNKVGKPLKGGWGATADNKWRQDLQVGDKVDVLTLKLRWIRGEVIGTDPDKVYIKHATSVKGKQVQQSWDFEATNENSSPPDFSGPVMSIPRHSVRLAEPKTHTLCASSDCNEEKASFGVWDTRCLRAQTWRLPLRQGSELDILWKDGNWYNGVVREVLNNGASLRISPLATARGSTTESVTVYRGSCRIVPYKMMASGGWMEDKDESDDVRSSMVDQQDFFTMNAKQLKMRMLNIAESVNPALVIIDWDDTLFPTTHVMTQSVPNPSPAAWADLAEGVEHLIAECVCEVGSGNVIIVTNAGSDWVDLSRSTFMPSLENVMEHCMMVSAREGYASRFEHTQWKRHAFCQKLEEMWGMEINLTPNAVRYMEAEQGMSTYWPACNPDGSQADTSEALDAYSCTSDTSASSGVATKMWWDTESLHNTKLSEYSSTETTRQQKQLISIGDSILERQAAIEFGSKVPNCWVKSVKLDVTPACDRLSQEIGDLNCYLKRILHYKGSLDLDVSTLYTDEECGSSDM